MVITVQGGSLTTTAADAVVLGVLEGGKRVTGAADAVDKAAGGAVAACLRSKDFDGKRGQTAVVYAKGRLRARRILLVGLGKAEELDAEAVRQAAGNAVQRARGLAGVNTVATVVHGAGRGGLDAELAAQAVVEGSILANYAYDAYRTRDEDKRRRLGKTIVVEADKERITAVRRGAARGRVYAEAACFARDLCSTPSLDLTPRAFAERAAALADAKHGIKVTVLDDREIRRLKMGCFLGVAKGSDEPPRFLVLEYAPAGTPRATLAVVGKGITFDTGGISLKPADGMDRMKYDMSGAAAVCGVFHALSKLRPDVRVVGLAPLTENMPGGHAIKPGDVLRSMSGTTVEVNNTDAEGRLVLSDALAYARRYEPDAIVDLATLTGAVTIALGGHAIGMMGNDDQVIESLYRAGERTGERVWQLPLWPEYRELLKSDIADIRNSAGREAGTIAGGLFLQRFVGEIPWAHLDIAGTAWTEKDRSYAPKGSTGVGVRLVLDWIEHWGKE